MKLFKLGSTAVYEKLVMNIIFIIQLCVMLVGVNVLTANFNNRNILYEPFKEILDKGGFYINAHPVEDEQLIKDAFSKNNVSFDDVSAQDIKVAHINVNGIYTDLYIYEDVFFDKLAMSLVEGSWQSAKNENANEHASAIAVQNESGIMYNNTYNSNLGEIKISGVLTDPTYVPTFRSMSIYGDVTQFYTNYSHNIATNKFILLMSETEYQKLSQKAHITQKLYYYENEPDDETQFKIYSDLAERFFVIDYKTINEHTMDFLNENLYKYLPLIILLLVVTVGGLISSTAINTLSQLNNYGIYFLCGMKWINCMKICMYNIMIVLGISTILSVGILFLMNILGFFTILGMNINLNNFIVTALILLVIFALSLIIPNRIIKKRSPVDILRNNN